MRNFELLEPASAHEASRMLADAGEESRLFAGGVALMLAMRQRLITPSHVVYMGGVGGLDRIEFDERQGLRIGALTRHQQIADSAIVQSRYPMLADMAAHVANPQVRNQGTLGGNLCYADPASDPPGCLMALGAELRTVGPQGERSIPLDEFFIDYYTTALEPAEVVTEIRVPTMASDSKGAYTRFLRTAAEHRPLVNVAVVARRNGGVCHEARIAIGASVPIPLRARRSEQYLNGKTVTLEALDHAAAIAAADITPVSDFRGSAEYRREMVRVVARRTLAEAFDLC
jgi:carbon-monoxide dehydrogenase medium subunit